MRVILVAGARPNFPKVAPLMWEMERYNGEHGAIFDTILVHTGQHYDFEMSQVFFQDLGLPQPDIHLGVGSGTHAEQTGRVMVAFEKILLESEPDFVVVVGDVNSTLAAALAAAKLHIPVGHIEAGPRTWDRRMPEEINRVLTDHLSDLLFAPTSDAVENLQREGIASERIFHVGNIMADTLLSLRERAAHRPLLAELGIANSEYVLLTLHRPDNVDDPDKLLGLLDAAEEISRLIPVVFPVHPRTRKQMQELGYSTERSNSRGLRLISPVGYLDCLSLEMNAKFVMTDSGGMQAETTILDVPCLTLYAVSGWTDTLTSGTNTVVGTAPPGIVEAAMRVLQGEAKQGKRPPLWDGLAASRIVDVLVER